MPVPKTRWSRIASEAKAKKVVVVGRGEVEKLKKIFSLGQPF
jgi:hypothetical protein